MYPCPSFFFFQADGKDVLKRIEPLDLVRPSAERARLPTAGLPHAPREPAARTAPALRELGLPPAPRSLAMAGPSSAWPGLASMAPFRCSAPTPPMKSSTAATPPRPDMEDSKFSVPRSRMILNNEPPLVHCKDCTKLHYLKALTARTKKNYSRQFWGGGAASIRFSERPFRPTAISGRSRAGTSWRRMHVAIQ